MEKKKITLLAIQMGSVIADRDSNIKKVRELLETCLSKRKADFVFLPEVWTVGWDCRSFSSSAEILSKSFAVTMLKSIAKKYRVNIIGVSNIEKNDISKYGVVISNNFNNPIEVIDFIEKPTNANSTFVSLGRYVLNPSIFNYIESEKDSLKELLLPDYIIKEKTLAFDTKALWLDVGTKENFRKANSFDI